MISYCYRICMRGKGVKTEYDKERNDIDKYSEQAPIT